MKYNYEALNSSGEEEDGEIEAINSEEAISKIRLLGLFPTKIKDSKLNTSALEEVSKIVDSYHKKKNSKITEKKNFYILLLVC